MISKIKKAFKKYTLSELIRLIDMRYGLGAIESTIASNWFNPFATIWLNFRSFPLKQAFKIPVYLYGRPRMCCLSGNMLIEGTITSGMIHFNQSKSGSPSNMMVQSEISNRGTVIFRGKGAIGTGTKIFVDFGRILDIGSDFKITDMCNIGCLFGISIGAQSWIVHRCQILDSNYHFIANFTHGIVPRYGSPIKIGKGCWICNSSTITGGTVLPDFTIVASNSLVSKDFSDIPQSSLIGGIPAKFIMTGLRRVENSKIEREIIDFYKNHMNDIFKIPKDATLDEYSRLNEYKY